MEDNMINLAELSEYKELLIPEGKYQVEVTKATLGVTSTTQRPKVDLTMKIVDTIPAGENLEDLEGDFEYPIEKTIFGTMLFPIAGDKSGTVSFFTKMLSDWVKNFSVEVEDPNDMKAFAESFVGTEGGVIIKYEPSDRNDPKSDPRATVDKSCSIG